MKKKIFKICIYISTVLFLGFVSLYVYTWIVDASSWESFITVVHGDPVTATDYSSKKIYVIYHHRVRIAIEKNQMKDMRGCNLVFFNQDMPYELNAMFAFSDGDKIIGKSGFKMFGISFGSGTHSTKMLGCAENDRTSQTVFLGCGIYFSDIDHTVNKEQNWWTVFVNLWYPIILFGILPAIFVVKKWRDGKANSTRQP